MSTAGSSVALAAFWSVAGTAFGLVYFAVLRLTVDLYGKGYGGLVSAALTLARFAAAILLFGLAARVGALPLLLTFFGFLLARALALRTAMRNA